MADWQILKNRRMYACLRNAKIYMNKNKQMKDGFNYFNQQFGSAPI